VSIHQSLYRKGESMKAVGVVAKYRSLSYPVVALFTLATVTSCTRDHELMGRWEAHTSSAWMDVIDDSTLVWGIPSTDRVTGRVNPGPPPQHWYRYTLRDDRLIITPLQGGEPSLANYRVSNDTLFISLPGQPGRLTLRRTSR
jgi:hypothetical protein